MYIYMCVCVCVCVSGRAGTFDQYNGPSVSIQCGEFLDWRKICQLLKKDAAPSSKYIYIYIYIYIYRLLLHCKTIVNVQGVRVIMNNNIISFVTRIVNLLEHYDRRNILLLATRLLAVRLENCSLIPLRARNLSSPKHFGRL